MLIIADTSPINYLVLIDLTQILCSANFGLRLFLQYRLLSLDKPVLSEVKGLVGNRQKKTNKPNEISLNT